MLLIVGDLNIHQISWLRFSNGDTPRGRMLKNLCDEYGFQQFVSQPTRGEYLLDLVLAAGIQPKTKICGQISDHACNLVEVPDAMETRRMPSRYVWKFRDANWQDIKHALSNQDWRTLMRGSIDDAIAFLNKCLNDAMRSHILVSGNRLRNRPCHG